MRTLFPFGVASLAAICIGMAICTAAGIAPGGAIRSLAAWVAGLAVAALLAWRAGRRADGVALIAAPIALATTLVAPDQQGVHRWIDLGPVHANVAMLVLPSAAVALLRLRAHRWVWGAALAALALLAVQPDASQASAWAGVLAFAALRAPLPVAWRVGAVVAAGAVAALAWLRPDPLAPVPEVEGIVALGLATAPPLGGTAIVALAATAAAPFAGRADRNARAALALIFALWMLAPLLGAFPVPFVGVGMSPVLGGWIGVGLLAAGGRR